MSIGIPRIQDNNTETLGADKTLVVGDAYYQTLDPAGTRTVILPAGDSSQGARVMIQNTADQSEAITVQQSDASTTVAVIDQNESAEFVCNGQSTTTGWQAVGITEA